MKMNRKIHSPLIFILVLILSLKISVVKSQATNPSNPSGDDNNNLYANTKFSPTVAITVIILVVALFFMGFFSIYIRQCSDVDTGGAGGNNSVRRNALGFAAQRGGDRGRVGLEPSVIETFPMFSYSEVRDHKIGKGALECAVCLNEFEDDETLRFIPKCDHVFHPECIDAWLENHVTCPVCRTNLTPQAGDEPYRLPEINQEENNDVAIQVDVQEDKIEVKPEVNRVWSFKYSNRPPRTESFKGGGGRNMFGLGKFRSHSTGHLIQPCENVDRFTLRLPEELRKEMMNRALLNRAKSVAAVSLPREGSSTTRKWFRTGSSVGSMKGSSSLPKINEPDRGSKSGRWQFFTRKVSMKSTKVVAGDGEASTSTIEPTQSFKKKEPKNIDEKSLLRSEPVQPPWL